MTTTIQLPRQPISLQKRLPHFLGQRLQAIERADRRYVLRQLGFAAHVVEIAAWIEAEPVSDRRNMAGNGATLVGLNGSTGPSIILVFHRNSGAGGDAVLLRND